MGCWIHRDTALINQPPTSEVTRAKKNEMPRRAVYPGRKENEMSEREIERILAEEADEAKVWEAIEEYLKGEE